MDKQLLEYLHQTEQIPDRYYNQLNGKSAQENYIAYRKKQTDKLDSKFWIWWGYEQ